MDFVYAPIIESDLVVGIFCEGYDVTKAHLDQQALHESESPFKALVNVTANAVYRMGPDWREMRRLDGAGFMVDTSEPTTGWVEIYVPADEQPRVRDAVEQATFELEHKVLRVDGTVGWTHSRAIPLLDTAGNLVEWFGTASDITARVQTDQSFTRLFKLPRHRSWF